MRMKGFLVVIGVVASQNLARQPALTILTKYLLCHRSGDSSTRRGLVHDATLPWRSPAPSSGRARLHEAWEDCDMTLIPKDRSQWKRWFAWHPVIIDNVSVWFEIVERRRRPDIFDWAYHYRTIDQKTHRRRRRVLRRRSQRRLAHLWRA
jgi:hypothetical protein